MPGKQRFHAPIPGSFHMFVRAAKLIIATLIIKEL
jgi:hypothetical protein